MAAVRSDAVSRNGPSSAREVLSVNRVAARLSTDERLDLTSACNVGDAVARSRSPAVPLLSHYGRHGTSRRKGLVPLARIFGVLGRGGLFCSDEAPDQRHRGHYEALQPQ